MDKLGWAGFADARIGEHQTCCLIAFDENIMRCVLLITVIGQRSMFIAFRETLRILVLGVHQNCSRN